MRKVCLLLMGLLVFVVLAGCGDKVDDATKDTYIAKAEALVAQLNEAEYEAVFAELDDVMQDGLPVSEMAGFEPIFEASGEFVEFSKSSVEEKDGIHIVVLVAKYSEDDRIFTVSYNGDDEVAGLYVR